MDCAFCGRNADLKRSHIIPKFVFRYLRESSPTGHIRLSSQPAVRAQDGLVLPLLCEECEALFGGFESETARRVFRPAHYDDAWPGRYGPWFGKFCASVVWRIATYMLMSNERLQTEERTRQKVQAAAAAWRDYIRGETANPGVFRLHAAMFDQGFAVDTPLPANINRYMARSIQMDFAASQRQSMVMAKMCKLIVFGVVEDNSPTDWVGTRIGSSDGTFPTGLVRFPGGLLPYFVTKATESADFYRNLPERQRAMIARDAAQRQGAVRGDGHIRALSADIDLAGLEAVFALQEQD